MNNFVPPKEENFSTSWLGYNFLKRESALFGTVNLSWNFGRLLYHTFWQSEILRSAQTVNFYVFYGYQNKERLFRSTALTDWIL